MASDGLRPQSLDEMIGQELIKRKARIAIGAALQRGEPLPHVLLTSSGGGLGKTTLAAVLANEMFAPLTATTGQCLYTAADLRNLMIRLDPSGCSVVFIDEIHGMGYLAAEELLLILEEGILNVNPGGASGPVQMKLAPFTMIGATTRPSAISGPLMQRFGLTFHFEFYATEEMVEIVRRYSFALKCPLKDEVVTGIAERSHGIPRQALRLLERVRDVAQARRKEVAEMEDCDLALSLENMDGLGLTRPARRLLQILADASPKPVSARSLALALGLETATVTDNLEPLLVRLGLLVIGAGGRRITDQGLAHVQRERDKMNAKVRG